MMTMAEAEWVKAAIYDATVVAELLVRMKQSQAATPLEAVLKCSGGVVQLRWGNRQQRSRSSRCNGFSHRKEADSSKNTAARCSPTTPLSWSGGGGSASLSTAADGYEENSRQGSCYTAAASRSKIPTTNEASSASTKRSRRHKRCNEVKEEENLTLKEKVHLKRGISAIRSTTIKEEKFKNEKSKHFKVEVNLHSVKNKLFTNVSESDKENSNRSGWRLSSSIDQAPSTSSKSASVGDHHHFSSSDTGKAASTQDNFFLLPDLNMIPSDDHDSDEETLYGIS